MTNLLDKIKEYINDITNNVKEVFFNDDLDKINLDKIIEREYKKAIEGLRKFKIIEYIERKYGIDYKIPELEIVDDDDDLLITGKYLPLENKIRISKKSIEIDIDNIDSHLEFLGYKEIRGSIGDTQYIEYPDILYNSKFLYPFYVDDGDIIESIARAIILLIILHEFWHSIDFSILNKLKKDPTIKDRDYLLTILNDHDNFELRASASEVVMDFLVNGFHKDERGYIAAYKNIPECRNYIEEIDKLEKNDYILYKLGFCYGNIIVAKYGSSLEENIDKIIDDIVYLDKERAIDEIKHYVYNPDKLLHD